MTISLFLTSCAAFQTPATEQTPVPAPVTVPVTDPQTAKPGPSAGDSTAEGWSSLDRVVIVVNDDIVTSAQLLGRYSFALRNGFEKPKTRAEQDEFVNEIAHEAIRTRLKAQAGEALGFEPAQVERIQKNDLERAIKARGGVVGFSEFLASRSVTAEDYRQVRRDFIFTQLWEDAITGAGASVSARPSSDRFVRPGLLRFEYANAQLDPAFLADVGGRAETIHFRRLVLVESDKLPLPQVLALAQQLRGQLVEGADIEGLIQTYAYLQGRETDVTTELASAMRVIPQAAAFFQAAKPGDVSDALPIRGKNTRGYALYRLEKRTAGEVPALEDFAVQQKLTHRMQTEFDQQRIEAALQRALSSSYVWRFGEGDVSAADSRTPANAPAPSDRAAPTDQRAPEGDARPSPAPPDGSAPRDKSSAPDAAAPPHDPKH